MPRHPLNSTFFIGILAWGAGCLPLSASADSDMDALMSMKLEELMNVKITASTLTDETLRSAPASVTVFTHQQIQSMGIDYLHELMNYVPGLQSVRTADRLETRHAIHQLAI